MREFDERCTSYRECYDNIVQVLNDSYEAIWIRYKRQLRGNYDDENIKELGEIYLDQVSEIATEILQYLYNDYQEVYEKLEVAMQDISDGCDEKLDDIAIQGGGFGPKGMVAGMLGAKFAAEFAGSYVYNRSLTAGKRATSEFRDYAENLFRGERAKHIYLNSIDFCLKLLTEIAANEFENITLHRPGDLDDIERLLGIVSRNLSDEMSQKLSIELICRLPFDNLTYQFLADNYTNSEKLFLPIKEGLDLKDDLVQLKNNWSFTYMEEDILPYRVAFNQRVVSERENLYSRETEIDKEELLYKLLFRVRAKALMAAMNECEWSVNKYIWELQDDNIVNLVPSDRRDAYIIGAVSNCALYDTGLAVRDAKNNVKRFDFSEISEALVVGPCYAGGHLLWIAAHKNTEIWELVEIKDEG